jgi:Uncharacterized protein conserved in bacteria (DUF2200)
LKQQIELESDFETFFDQAPRLHANSSLIKGVICGVRVEEIEDPLEQKVRYLDKLKDDGEDSPAVRDRSLRLATSTRPVPTIVFQLARSAVQTGIIRPNANLER